MNTLLTPEQEELQSSLRRFFEARADIPADASEAATQAFDQPVWSEMAQMGLHGLTIPESLGGAGYGLVEQCLVLEELGRSLAMVPYAESALLATQIVLECAGASERDRLLPDMASGERIVSLALPENFVIGEPRPGPGSLDAADEFGSWKVTGSAAFVPFGDVVDTVIVVATTPEGEQRYFSVATSQDGVARRRLAALDPSRPVALLVLDAADAVVFESGPGSADDQRALYRAAIGFAAEYVGGAEQCLSMSVDYAKIRHQFGRAIGSFQAIKHRCADTMVAVEASRAAVRYAAAVSGEASELPVAASLAKAYCADTYVDAASNNVHIHGALGFTVEHRAHRYMQRAQATRSLLGTSAQFRQRLADLLEV